MITLITGAPGTGKSNLAVSLMAELLGKDGRQIYVDGIPELKLEHQVLGDASNWHNEVPDGSCIVIDEVQRVWRPRGPGQKVPDHIAALETHRHRGLDFYVITQAPALVDSNVRGLVGRHVHIRDLGVLGRWMYEWPECNPQCATAWKNAPIKKKYRLNKAVQAKYKSASIHVKPIRSIPWMLLVMVIALITVGVMGWRTYSMIQAKINPPKPELTKAPGQAQPGATAPGAPGQAGQVAPAKFIDDRVAWIPRVSRVPESAPAYDELRKVVAMPVVVGCVQFKDRARCFTQQGTDAGLDDREAKAWLAAPPFDPYKVEAQQQAPASQPVQKNGPEAASAPALTLIQDQGQRPAPSAAKRS